MKKSKFLVAVLFSTVFIFANTVHAASLVTREASDLDENFQTKITLSFDVPSTPDQAVDVVFVADTATKNFAGNLYSNLATMAGTLDLYTGTQKAHVALVLYGRGSHTMFGLTDAATVDNAFITSALASEDNAAWLSGYSFGADLQSGVERAKSILDASTTGTTKANRHIVLLTDGSATLYNNADGDPASVVFYGNATDLKPMSNMDANGDVGSPSRATTSTNLLDEAGGDYAEAFDGLFARGSEIEAIAAKAYKYVNSNYTADEKADITAKIADNSVAYYTSAQVNNVADYPFISTEIGAYMGAKALKAAKDAGYGIHTIGYLYEWGWEDNCTDYILKLLAVPSRGMVEWTENLGKLYFHKTKTISADALADDLEAIADSMFGAAPIFGIQDEIGYGSYEDETPYNFNFVNDLDKISITIDGVELDKEKISDNVYEFKRGEYDFLFVYQEEDGEAKEAVAVMTRTSALGGQAVVNYYEELTPETRKTEIGEYSNLKASNRSQVYLGDDVVEELDPATVSYTVGGNPKTSDDIMYIIIPMVCVLGFGGIVARREFARRRN